MFSKIIRLLLGGHASDIQDAKKVESYEYPNEFDLTTDDAVCSLWQQYIQSGNRIHIVIQGMGGSVEQYHIVHAILKDGLLTWETADDRDPIQVDSLEEFQLKFLDWARKKVTPFSDTGDFAFGVIHLKDAS